jgi:hypothetical protein
MQKIKYGLNLLALGPDDHIIRYADRFSVIQK